MDKSELDRQTIASVHESLARKTIETLYNTIAAAGGTGEDVVILLESVCAGIFLLLFNGQNLDTLDSVLDVFKARIADRVKFSSEFIANDSQQSQG